MKKNATVAAALLVAGSLALALAGTGQPMSAVGTTRDITLDEAVQMAVRQNPQILTAEQEIRRTRGVVLEVEAQALPQITMGNEFAQESKNLLLDGAPPPPSTTSGSGGSSGPATGSSSGALATNNPMTQSWNVTVTASQLIYSGGQVTAAIHIAKYTQDATIYSLRDIVDTTIANVRSEFYAVLLDRAIIQVQEQNINLLGSQLKDQNNRFEAGTVPRFNVLQAEVALANERPRLIQARNSYRISKNNLVNLLGFRLPPEVLQDVPMELTDKLDAEPYEIELPVAIAKAFENRSELASARKSQDLRKEGVIGANSNYKPVVQLVGGYGARNSEFDADPGYTVHGVNAGAQFTWSIFDGFMTKGKVDEAKAQYQGSKVDVDNEVRSIELEVRTDFSNFLEARETLESQKKVQEEAEEALRLARARNGAGAGTQLDVLSAETSLTQARSTQVQALHDYDVARARLERAMGVNIMQTSQK